MIIVDYILQVLNFPMKLFLLIMILLHLVNTQEQRFLQILLFSGGCTTIQQQLLYLIYFTVTWVSFSFCANVLRYVGYVPGEQSFWSRSTKEHLSQFFHLLQACVVFNLLLLYVYFLLYFVFFIVLNYGFGILSKLHWADAFLLAWLIGIEAYYNVGLGVAVVQAGFQDVGELAVAVGDVMLWGALRFLAGFWCLLSFGWEHCWGVWVFTALFGWRYWSYFVLTRSWAILLLVFESLNHISQGRQRLVYVLGFSNSVEIILTIDLLAPCQVDKGKLRKKHLLILGLLDLQVLLAIHASTHKGRQLSRNVLLRIQLNLKHGMTPGAQQVLDSFESFPLIDSMMQYCLRLAFGFNYVLSEIFNGDDCVRATFVFLDSQLGQLWSGWIRGDAVVDIEEGASCWRVSIFSMLAVLWDDSIRRKQVCYVVIINLQVGYFENTIALQELVAVVLVQNVVQTSRYHTDVLIFCLPYLQIKPLWRRLDRLRLIIVVVMLLLICRFPAKDLNPRARFSPQWTVLPGNSKAWAWSALNPSCLRRRSELNLIIELVLIALHSISFPRIGRAIHHYIAIDGFLQE